MIVIDYRDPRPIYEQVVDKFKQLILREIIAPDTKLPSVRNLAIELSINPNTIQKAYEKLEEQGLIYVIRGRGNFVANIETVQMKYKMEQLEKLKNLYNELRVFGFTKEEILNYLSSL